MNVARAALAAAGAAALLLGVTAVVAPDAVAGGPIDAAIATLGNDYLLLVPFGAAAIVIVAATLAARSRRGVDQAAPPAPEGVPTGEPPGAGFDRFVEDRWLALRRGGGVERVRDRLRETAVRTLTWTAGCSREVAVERVERGAWTDDPAAAAFLAEESPDSRWGALVDAVTGHPRARRRARRAAAAIDRLDRGDGRS